MDKRLKKMVLTALFTSLVTVATLVVRIPSPLNGYVNLGDCIILLSAWLLSPLSGAFAGGVGSMLADLIGGYPQYAPGTLVIKGAFALCTALLFHLFLRMSSHRKKKLSTHIFSMLGSAIPGEAIMVLGYFLYAWLLLGNAVVSAASSIPGNLAQASIGIVAGMLLYPVVLKSGITKD